LRRTKDEKRGIEHVVSATPKIFSVDVEDYFHVEAFSDVVDRSTWDVYECRVDANTRRLLDLLDRHQVRATFFVLGWVANRQPRLVAEIVNRGHEAACHSYWHRLVYSLTPDEFREDTRHAKDVIEQAAGTAVEGYRAPSYSITRRSLWALDVLAELGFEYDSSIFPIVHDVYGIPDAPRVPFTIATPSGPILECPITTFRLWGARNLPIGGGGYLRILPMWYTKLGVRRANEQGVPLIAYVHPWEIDPEQPRLRGRVTSRLRHYTNLGRTQDRLQQLLATGGFRSFRDSNLAEAARPVDGPLSKEMRAHG
jgi:polysaccharide deacetylase family protein (PEP-CTERM system associated)